jgi:hypothetical protein
MSDSPLDLIANKNIDDGQLMSAIRALGRTTEPPYFWTNIANNKEYRLAHRRHAIFQLFSRHVRPKKKLSDVALVLKEPNWLEDRDLAIIEDLAGHIPVQLTSHNTVFVIYVLPELRPSDRFMVFLSVSGNIERNEFLRLLRGEEVDQTTKDSWVIEIGFIPYEEVIAKPSENRKLEDDS